MGDYWDLSRVQVINGIGTTEIQSIIWYRTVLYLYSVQSLHSSIDTDMYSTALNPSPRGTSVGRYSPSDPILEREGQ